MYLVTGPSWSTFESRLVEMTVCACVFVCVSVCMCVYCCGMTELSRAGGHTEARQI